MATKIRGLFIEGVAENFDIIMQEVQGASNLSTEEFDRKIEDKMGEIISEYDEIAINAFIQLHTIKYDKYVAILIDSLTQISKANESVFKMFFTYVGLLHVAIGKIVKSTEGVNVDKRDTVIISQYLQLLRLADQIGIITLNGYPDGAIMIWRAFYEQALSLQLLMKYYDNDLCGKFIDHNNRNTKRKVESYEKRRDELKFPPLSDETIDYVNANAQKLKAKYGNGYLENDYGWVEGLFEHKGRITLLSIEEHLEMGKYRPFYIWASSISHSGVEAMKRFMTESNKINLQEISAPQIDLQKIIDALQLTIATLEECNKTFMQIYSVEHEYDINRKLLTKLYKDFQKTFASCN